MDLPLEISLDCPFDFPSDCPSDYPAHYPGPSPAPLFTHILLCLSIEPINCHGASMPQNQGSTFQRTIPDYPRSIFYTYPAVLVNRTGLIATHYPGLSPLHFLHLSCCACQSNGMNCHGLPCPKTSGPNSSTLSRTIAARFFTAILRWSK